MSTATTDRRKRGVVKRSIANLNKRLIELEASTEAPDEVHCHAQRLQDRLQALDTEFRSLHYQIVESIDESEKETIDTEQATLDKHDTDVDSYSVRIHQLFVATATSSTTAGAPDKSSSLTRILDSLKKSFQDIGSALAGKDLTDVALIQQYQEELMDLKSELSTCREMLTTLYIMGG